MIFVADGTARTYPLFNIMPCNRGRRHPQHYCSLVLSKEQGKLPLVGREQSRQLWSVYAILPSSPGFQLYWLRKRSKQTPIAWYLCICLPESQLTGRGEIRRHNPTTWSKSAMALISQS